jgi:hypothetical protein
VWYYDIISQQSQRERESEKERESRVFNDLIDDFTKSDFKSFLEDFEIFKITLKNDDLI